MGCPTPRRNVENFRLSELYCSDKRRLLMRKNLLAIALLLLATASLRRPAIQYEFRQTTQSDLETIPSTDLRRPCHHRRRPLPRRVRLRQHLPARHVRHRHQRLADDDLRRPDLEEVVHRSQRRQRRQRHRRPQHHHRQQEDRRHQDARRPPDRSPASRPSTTASSISYDITLQFGNMPLTQRVQTTIDKWTTTPSATSATRSSPAARSTPATRPRRADRRREHEHQRLPAPADRQRHDDQQPRRISRRLAAAQLTGRRDPDPRDAR